jgi:DNA replication and repair protein RecF
MTLKKIELKNFKIHTDTSLDFSEKINYIIGGNGQGKTTILEAIYYLCTSKNFNSRADSEFVNFNNSVFEVSGTFNNISENLVKVFYSVNDAKKYLLVNGKQIYRAAELIGKYPVVILTPADHSITQGSPSERRRFVDSIISQASQTYLQFLLEYNKTLKQRAILLNRLKETNESGLFSELDAWSEKLVIAGSGLIIHRKKFVNEFNIYLHDSYNKILNNKEIPEIVYSFLNEEDTESDIEKKFRNILFQKRNDELRRSSNLIGPHRDDFIFSINGFDLKKYGSQGQHKTFQIMLRFAEFNYLKDSTGRNPIFLMDDVFGELDASRAGMVSEHLGEIGQAFITLTDFSDFSYLKKTNKDLVIKVFNGKAAYA